MPHDAAPSAHKQFDYRLLADALAQVDDAVIIVDNDYQILYLNAKAAAQYGVDAGMVLGRPLASLHQHFWLDPGDEEAAFRSLAQHGSWHGQNIHGRHDGRQLHVDVTVTVLKGDDGEPLGLVAIIRDVTAQKQLAAALHEMEELHDLALEGGQLGTWAVDLETNALQWGARCRQFCGLGPDEPASLEKSYAIIHPEDRPRAEAAFAAAANPASVGRYAVEKRIVRPDGTMRWVATRGKVFFHIRKRRAPGAPAGGGGVGHQRTQAGGRRAGAPAAAVADLQQHA